MFPSDDPPSPGGSYRIVFEIVEVVEQEEADVEAIDALLRAMYGALVATDVLVLLGAARLADRFLVSQAVAQLLASRLAYVPADAITDDVLALVFDAYSALLATPLPLELIDKCRVFLRTAFRNVPDVVTQPALLERFLALPHAAVVAWAKSDSLQVHSANEVVYLLSAWVRAQETAGCPCSAEQLELLVDTMRLAACGPSYLQMIVPALDWFKSGLGRLGAFALSRELKKAGLLYTRPFGVPNAWWADTPREKLASCEAVMEFKVNAEKLEKLEMLDGKNCTIFDSVFVNGFWVTPFVKCSASKTAPGELTLGCFAQVDVAKMTKATPWTEHSAVAFTCSKQVGKAAEMGPSTFFVTGSKSWGYADTLGVSAASVAALVAPHLEGGQLKGKATFANVDLLCRRV
ncbi:hypothetical protein FOA52_002771 [Chlamydomonas sp. UWO 241]|nr:hypothetical protein FOA52_002771 [Chlamydomonas sp. UWO 241]